MTASGRSALDFRKFVGKETSRMSSFRRLLPVLVYAFAAAALAQPKPAPTPVPAPPPEARAAARLQETWRSHGSPGVSVAVADRGRIAFGSGAGYADLESLSPATSQTVYDIGSISKVHTAVAIMQLVEQGKVRLEDDIRTYIPSFPDKGTPITIRHLMTHTSGIRHYKDSDFAGTPADENVKRYESIEEAIAIFKDDPLLFPPGKFYSYTSYGVNMLQAVVEKGSGQRFEVYMREHVWGPAGMQATQFNLPERVVPHRARSYQPGPDGGIRNVLYGDLTYKFASGGMMSTAQDLALFGAALNAGRLLKKETLSQMWSPQISGVMEWNRDGEARKPENEQGLMWRVATDAAGRRYVSHCGAVQRFHSCLVNYPDRDLVVALLENSYEGVGIKENLAFAEMFIDTATRP
jgi:serine beta-lactamase-like protein LACTB, mitochondrial